MKGLILNDLYNIGHNAKQMLLVVAVWGLCFASGASIGAYIMLFSVLFCMMTATTFSFDEKCGWTKYAMVLPIAKRDYVLAKYIINFIFSLMGSLVGMVLTLVVNQIQGKTLDGNIGVFCMIGICISLLLGDVFIPLLIKFGAEKARIILVAAILIPVGIGFCLQRFMVKMGIALPSGMVEKMIYFLPVAVLILTAITLFISIGIFNRKEF